MNCKHTNTIEEAVEEQQLHVHVNLWSRATTTCPRQLVVKSNTNEEL